MSINLEMYKRLIDLMGEFAVNIFNEVDVGVRPSEFFFVAIKHREVVEIYAFVYVEIDYHHEEWVGEFIRNFKNRLSAYFPTNYVVHFRRYNAYNDSRYVFLQQPIVHYTNGKLTKTEDEIFTYKIEKYDEAATSNQ
jgi:hypothetical protein